MHTYTGTIPNAKAAELMTRSSIRNTFRKYAFFHESTVSDDTRTIITECISEFKAQHSTIADTWEKGYGRLRTAVIETVSTTTTSTTTGHVKKLLSAIAGT